MEILSWLLSLFFIFILLGIVVFQFVTLTDLELDQINSYDASSRINITVLPEFIIQGVHCAILLVTRQWFMLLLSLPHLYHNVNSYMGGRHLVDVTEIFNQLNQEKRQRMLKIVSLLFTFLCSLFWLLWSFADE